MCYSRSVKKCWGWILTLGLPGLVGISVIVHSVQTQAQANPRWNLLLISIDTLRADHVGAYGASGAATHNLDRLARQGVLFEQVFTPVVAFLGAGTG